MQPRSNDWPDGDYASVPYRLYTDPDIFTLELQRIFYGDGWSYAGLEAELPSIGDFKTTLIGNRSVILARDDDGSIHAFANQCAHRGVKFCQREFGNTRFFVCPYHQWSYDRRGNLRGVPFINGVKGNGGMPQDFSRAAHGLPRLSVTQRNGVIFVSFGAAPPAFADYLGTENLRYFDRVFDGRGLRVLGYARQLIPGNWKLMFENIKDPYHASLLHVFLVTFGLFRADQDSQVKMDDGGGHALLISRRGEQKRTEHTRDIANLKEDFVLADPRLLDPVREFDDTATVVMQTVWPNLIVQQQSNTLALRQLRPRSPRAFELHWTFFGYADDSAAMTQRRLRQANLMSAAGLVSGDDSEVIKLAQDGIEQDPTGRAVLLMGGRDTHDTEHMVTEAAVRAFYRHYRDVMQL
jgi:salicylate 5-hydroxylase large subunit